MLFGFTTRFVYAESACLVPTHILVADEIHLPPYSVACIQCNGSDVFGSDICTCRPYLIFGIEEAVKEAQNGGSGVVIYFRKEGRALGEVTKVSCASSSVNVTNPHLC